MKIPVKIYNTNLSANIDAKIVKDVKEKYPKTEVSVCFDLDCELSKLRSNESACWGDGKYFYFILKQNS